eukprot:TRINITY_DN162_c0_g1_i1.p1 TRINITY_DN162_c0_g1~~TRINITY_DN162_c0_g1_i1.p1  ORF type:complete len:599 (-),score=161.11 TRINITY_DN162_c0_g1_i1:67-1863(-)
MDFNSLLRKDVEHSVSGSPKISYGTAGFRTDASLLRNAMFRVGVFATLRSRAIHCRRVGVMITASHNPVKDNGCKLIDDSGEMLSSEWEPFATSFINASHEECVDVLKSLMEKVGVSESSEEGFQPTVVVGMDTRPHSAELYAAVLDGVEVAGGRSLKCGECTTPQLHYYVKTVNQDLKESLEATEKEGMKDIDTPLPSIESLQQRYWKETRDVFGALYEYMLQSTLNPQKLDLLRSAHIILDGADGIGGKVLDELDKSWLEKHLDMSIVNCARPGSETLLNDHAGAEFVHKERKMPRNASKCGFNDPKTPYCIGVTLDGDADRVVLFRSKPGMVEEDSDIDIIDGDRIAALLATFVLTALSKMRPHLDTQKEDPIRVAVVQTAYANGASTDYMLSLWERLRAACGENVIFSVQCVPTGVKHLHKEAVKHDIGIYFEANGHGTMRMDSTFAAKLEGWQNMEKEDNTWLSSLRLMGILFSDIVGDAIRDFLGAYLALGFLGMDTEELCGIYTDNASLMTKVVVKDRTMIQTTWDERRIVSLPALQDAIDRIVMQAGAGSRCFVRPSGTEDVVRVYGEGRKMKDVTKMVRSVEDAVREYC